MQVLFETTYLAPGQIQSPDDIALNGEQIVDEAEFFRAATMTFFPRGNVRVEFDFTVHYSFASTVLAEVFVLTLPSQVPMTNADNGVLQCVCGYENPATSQIVYMSGAVLKSARVVKQVGTSVDVRYSFVGPGFTSQTPGSGLPTYPNANEITQVFRRGKVAITNGATTVAVTFSSQLPGLPGADPDCWVSGPTGAEMFDAFTLTDTVTTLGFTAQLSEAAPSGQYYLNYVVYM